MRFPDDPRVTDDQYTVEQMIRAGMTLGEMEEAIELLPAGDERKSALWLTAWSRLGRTRRSAISQRDWVHLGSGV